MQGICPIQFPLPPFICAGFRLNICIRSNIGHSNFVRSAVGMPPMYGGFLHDVRAPFWLLEMDELTLSSDELWIVPMSAYWYGNPVYSHPPHSFDANSCKLCDLEKPMLAKAVKMAIRIDFEKGTRTRFFYAVISVTVANGTVCMGYVNLYSYVFETQESTLFCKVVEPPGRCKLDDKCLCGQCRSQWYPQGWRCPWLSSGRAEEWQMWASADAWCLAK